MKKLGTCKRGVREDGATYFVCSNAGVISAAEFLGMDEVEYKQYIRLGFKRGNEK